MQIFQQRRLENEFPNGSCSEQLTHLDFQVAQELRILSFSNGDVQAKFSHSPICKTNIRSQIFILDESCIRQQLSFVTN